MGKKIELWLLGLIVVFFIILLILNLGILRDEFTNKRSPEPIRKIVKSLSEIPKNVYHTVKHLSGHNIDKPPALKKHEDKKRFEQFIEKKRNALLILPRYNQHQSKAQIDIIDLNDFTIIHTYYFNNIDEANKQIKNKDYFSRLEIDFSPVRFRSLHPIILDDGSIISDSGGAPLYKLDLCSSGIQFINEDVRFHHSKEFNHEGNIYIPGRIHKVYSKYNNKIYLDGFKEDLITKVNSNGEILYKKSVIDILTENKILPDNFRFSAYLDGNNYPVYLNDIQPALTDSKYWKKGDLFLSIRSLSAIIHYRPNTNQVVNFLTGPFARQHDVDIISEKEISIFNNYSIEDNSFSEILIYNFETNKFEKKFNEQLKKENFKTIINGLSHILNDGSLMVEETIHGRILLFNSKGQKEWEYINKEINGEIGRVFWSRIIEDELFVEKFKSLVENKECIK